MLLYVFFYPDIKFFMDIYKVRKWFVVLSLHSFALMISLVAQEL